MHAYKSQTMYKFWIFSLLVFRRTENAEDAPAVESKLGKIIGKYHTINVFGNEYTVERYLSIRYAKPLVDDLRFRKPVPKEQFTEFAMEMPFTR